MDKSVKRMGLLWLFCVLMASAAQAQEQDMGIWTRLAVKYDFSKTTRLTVEEEARFFDNASRLDQIHTEAGITHELTDRLEGGVYYRFYYETDPERFYSLGHRGFFQLEYRIIDRDIEVSVRNRTQATFEDVLSSSDGLIPEWYSRYQIGGRYKPRKANWIPEANVEFWQFLNPEGSIYFDKYRITAAIEYRPGNQFRYELFYKFQQDIQQGSPDMDHIFGFNLTYMLN